MGIAINALCGAVVGVLSWVSNEQQLRQLSLWGMGSWAGAVVRHYGCSLADDPCRVWSLARWPGRLNLLQLGDEEAHYLGVDVRAMQRILLVLSALLVAVGSGGERCDWLYRSGGAASDAHVPRRRSPRLFPGSVLAGAILLLIADTLAQDRRYTGRNARGIADQPAGRAVVFMADFASPGGPLWLKLLAGETELGVCQRLVIDDVSLTLAPAKWCR